MRVSVGIHAAGGTENLAASLEQLRRYEREPVELLVLADGVAAAGLGAAGDIATSGTTDERGAPACFNRLIAAAPDADVLVFLEAGALVGPGWLGTLLAVLQADPRNGLAGPSTNRAWDLQGVYPRAREADITQIAAEAAARFATAYRGTEPLHSLADFCYAVRRPVIEAIGGADEAYGLGPCWEMDYTIRAARAGFRSVWAQGAFVYRRPPTARRAAREAVLFEHGRQLYQDRFCGLRLSGMRTGYAGHCHGDDCRHFAPAGQAAQTRPAAPLDQASQADPAAPCDQTVAMQSPPLPARATGSAGAVVSCPDRPLVSCVMPTSSTRADWLEQATRYFLAQDYPSRELVILDDGPGDRSAAIPADPRIRYHHLPRRHSIGAKRNLGAEMARGGIIAQWDDDDWYAATRLTTQVAPLLRNEAEITGLTGTQFLDLDQWRFWACTPELHRGLFVHNVHGGTLVYQRSVFERLARYPDASLAEDAVFLRTAVARGARLAAIDASEQYLYIRHGANTWAFTCGQHLDPRGWRSIPPPNAFASDAAFYAARSSARRSNAAPSQPLVSCIMPTWNRRRFVPRAIAYFQRQDYGNSELIIVDDGDDRIADLVPHNDPRIRYIGLPQRQRLGAKRNTAIEASSGEIIVHWDDDDWVAPDRISRHVAALIDQGTDISGCSTVWFCETGTGRVSLYRYPRHERPWLYGATLGYRRSLWQQKRFEDIDIGEDTRFVWAQPHGRMSDLGEQRLVVAMVHGANTSLPRPLVGPHWSAWQAGDAAQILGDDWAFYAAAAAEPQPRAA